MPATITDLVEAAHSMWATWGYPIWEVLTNQKLLPHVDDDEDFARIVRDTYCHELDELGITKPTIEAIKQDQFYWSAVGMSYMLRSAGLT